jgi:AhpD family alkylhydroperoxidase
VVEELEVTQRLDYRRTSPEGAKAFGAVSAYIAQCGLDGALIDLVYLRVSQINGCAYCIDLHTRDLIKKGVKIDKIVLVPVWREGGALFSAQEQAALAWTECVTRVAETAVPDEAFQAARNVLSEKEVSDLTLAVALMSAYNRIAISFRNTPLAAKEG